MSAIKPIFDPQQLQEIHDWFEEHCLETPQINENPQSPVITINDLIQFLDLRKYHRRIYEYPTYGQIMKEADKLGVGVSGRLEEKQFLSMLEKWFVPPQMQHQLQLAFMVFDTEERHFLELEELEVIVTGSEEPFTPEEVGEFLRDANMNGDGNVDYRQFVQSIFRIAPELHEIQVEYLYSDGDEDPSVPPLPPPPTPTPEPTPSPTPPPLPEPSTPQSKKGKKKKK